ncbi:hypothetical protein MHU86_23560 [Fragilaria crotonensis]|nr:hypothetical protein MHU86_23560 [Fragilaria crotonensis]
MVLSPASTSSPQRQHGTSWAPFTYTILLLLLSCHTYAEVEFPSLIDADDIAYFFNQNDLEGLHWALSNVFQRSERNPNPDLIVHKLPKQIISRGGGSTYTTAYKIKQDMEQAQYLADNLDDTVDAGIFRDAVLTYRKVLHNIPPLDELGRTAGLYSFRLPEDAGIHSIYNKARHHTDFDQLKDVDGNVTSILNQKIDTSKIQRQWFGEERDHPNPGVVVIDDILSDAALKRIRQLLLESTVWYQTKTPLRFGGYVGAYIDDGLHDRILLQLTFEIHKAFPRIMKGNPLKYLWAYKYDSEYTGINTHADEAAVNVNIWLTPDDANLDPTSGGLIIYTAKPPPDWHFQEYNTNTERVVEELLKPTNFANVTVPHRQNRAVMFDSALFHHSDAFNFKKGYENRRINLTILYGSMVKHARSAGGEEL